MLQNGTPPGVILAFGAVAISLGFGLWHRLGSLRHFVDHPAAVTPRTTYLLVGLLMGAVAAGLLLFPR